MAERYTSLMALVVHDQIDDVGAVVRDAARAGGVDRHGPIGVGSEVQEVFWGGRMQRAVVRAVVDEDGASLLRAEAYVGAEGMRQGLRRHAALLQALAAPLGDRLASVRDLSAVSTHDLDWLQRVAGGEVELEDAVAVHEEGKGTHWVHTHGAARFDVPDLELYGVNRSQLEAARAALRHVHRQLLGGGLRAELALEDGTQIYLVPVLDAWQRLPLDWPGIGRAGQPRVGHEGPRATLSVLHPRRFGRYRKDLKGVLARL